MLSVYEGMVSNYLLEMGFLPPKCGYFLLKRLLVCALEGCEILPLKERAYVGLGLCFGKSVSCVEKNIQNCISEAWLRGNVDVLYRDFGETIDARKGKPSNKQFILTALDVLKSKCAQ